GSPTGGGSSSERGPREYHMRCPGVSWQHGWCMRNSESVDMSGRSAGSADGSFEVFDDLEDVTDADGYAIGGIDIGPRDEARGWSAAPTTGELQLEDRSALRRVAGLSTELTDITEVEYRQLRLERVVLVGVWTEGSAASAEASMAELARLA